MFYDANIGERCEKIRTWFIFSGFLLHRMINKKPCYPHGRQSLSKVNFSNRTFSHIILCVAYAYIS